MSSALAMSDSFIIRHKSQRTVVFLWNMASGRAVWGSGGPRQSLSPFQAWCTSWNPDGLSYIRPFSLLTHTFTKLPLLSLNWNLEVPCKKTHLWEKQVKSFLLPFHHTHPLVFAEAHLWVLRSRRRHHFEAVMRRCPPRTLMDLILPTCGSGLEQKGWCLNRWPLANH